jgi:hypothetical protein
LVLLFAPLISNVFAHPSFCSGGVGFGCNIPYWYVDMWEMKLITLVTLVSLLGGICFYVLKSVRRHKMLIAREKNTLPIQ